MNVDTSVFHIPRVAYIGIYDPFKTSTLSKLGSSRVELLGLWNQKVQCHIRKGSLITPILSRTNPIPCIDTYFKIEATEMSF